MTRKRKSVPLDIRMLVLHEAGYKCGNPVCRATLTLDIHHLVPVSEDGPNSSDNLLALCPNCHALYHKGEIPNESIRAWKMILLALNEGYDRQSVDILLSLSQVGSLYVSGDGVLDCAPLIAAGLVQVKNVTGLRVTTHAASPPVYLIRLADRGKLLVEAWKRGDQAGVVNAISAN